MGWYYHRFNEKEGEEEEEDDLNINIMMQLIPNYNEVSTTINTYCIYLHKLLLFPLPLLFLRHCWHIVVLEQDEH